MSEKISVVEEQAKRIKSLEAVIAEEQKYSLRLLDMCGSQQRTIEYLVDPEFRKFAFRLNYDRLITNYLENECNGDEFV